MRKKITEQQVWTILLAITDKRNGKLLSLMVNSRKILWHVGRFTSFSVSKYDFVKKLHTFGQKFANLFYVNELSRSIGAQTITLQNNIYHMVNLLSFQGKFLEFTISHIKFSTFFCVYFCFIELIENADFSLKLSSVSRWWCAQNSSSLHQIPIVACWMLDITWPNWCKLMNNKKMQKRKPGWEGDSEA